MFIICRLLHVALVQRANAWASPRGEHLPLTPERAKQAGQNAGRRQQSPGCIYSANVPGFNPQRWAHVWRAPRNQAPGKVTKYTFEAEVESSIHPGRFSRVWAQYADPSAAGNKGLFSPVRKAASRLVDLNRAVRVDDGGDGFMVGAGTHFSYKGLIEPFKPKSAKKRRRGTSTELRPVDGRDDSASWLSWAALSFNKLFKGAFNPTLISYVCVCGCMCDIR